MKNRLLSILFVFIFFSFVFINSSYAVRTGADFTELFEYSYWEEFKEDVIKDRPFYIKDNTDDYYLLYCYPCNSHYDSWDIESNDIYFYMDNGTLVCRNDTLNEECTHFSDYVLREDNFSTSHDCWAYGGDYFTKDVLDTNMEIYLNQPIYSDVNRTEIFFSPVPATLAQVLELNSPVKTFQTMIVGMIPYLIAFLVGLVAFWKAWQLLLKELRKA